MNLSFFFCTQFNGFKYCYITVTIKHLSFFFFFKQLSDQTVLFSRSMQFKCQTVLFDP